MKNSRIIWLLIVLIGSISSASADVSGYVYWTDGTNRSVNRVSPGSSSVALRTDYSLPDSVSLYFDSLFVVDIADESIRRTNSTGATALTDVTAITIPTLGSAVDLSTGTLYWLSSNRFWKGSISPTDGTLTGITQIMFLGGTYRDLSLDPVGQNLYWISAGTNYDLHINSNPGRIRRASYAGTGAQTLVSGTSQKGLAVDPIGRKIYWGENGSPPAIKRAELDGTGVETIVSTGISYLTDVAVDFEDAKLYWVDLGNRSIRRSNLNGTAIETVVANAGYPLALTVGDPVDECPYNAAKDAVGQCGCNVADVDSDGDGYADCADQCPNSAIKSIPGSCGCSIADTDTDSDGTLDCNEQCPLDAAKVQPGVCGCGTSDEDSDGDGTLNCNEQCPLDPTKVSPGLCGCGTADVDSDGDSVLNCNDGCPADSQRTTTGVCGCERFEVITDSGKIECGDNPQLTQDSILNKAPTVQVGKNSLTVTMQKFSSPRFKGRTGMWKYEYVLVVRNAAGKVLRREITASSRKKLAGISGKSLSIAYAVRVKKGSKIIFTTKFSPGMGATVKK